MSQLSLQVQHSVVIDHLRVSRLELELWARLTLLWLLFKRLEDTESWNQRSDVLPS